MPNEISQNETDTLVADQDQTIEEAVEKNVDFFNAQFEDVLKTRVSSDVVDQIQIEGKNYASVQVRGWIGKNDHLVKLFETPTHKNPPRESESFILHLTVMPINKISALTETGRSYEPPEITNIITSENFTQENRVILEHSIDEYLSQLNK